MVCRRLSWLGPARCHIGLKRTKISHFVRDGRKPNVAILFVCFVVSCLLFAVTPFFFQAVEGSKGVTPSRGNQPRPVDINLGFRVCVSDRHDQAPGCQLHFCFSALSSMFLRVKWITISTV